jgi:putative phosphoesterase
MTKSDLSSLVTGVKPRTECPKETWIDLSPNRIKKTEPYQRGHLCNPESTAQKLRQGLHGSSCSLWLFRLGGWRMELVMCSLVQNSFRTSDFASGFFSELKSEDGSLRTEKSICIGVISDTHGLLRPEAVKALRCSHHIIHAGDVGTPEILVRLSAIAPVTAIRGNIDKGEWARKLPETEVAEIGGVSIYVLHDLAKLDLKPEAAGFRVVIFGHSHIPKQETRAGVLYFNPGSAGPRRFRLPATVGKLIIGTSQIAAEIIRLDV